MNQLWVRLSLAFALVLILSILLVALVVQLNFVKPGVPPPPEVVVYYEQLRNERVVPNPFLALAVVSGIAILAGVLLSRTLAAPMSELADAASGIGRGDFSRRVEPRGSQEMVAVASAFNDMAARLEQAESLRQKMLSDVAHELRHPLHVLQGNLQAMQDGVYPVNQEEIDRLIAQTRHLTVMVDDLHVLAQAEARQLPLRMQQVDIANLVKEVTAVYQPLASERGISLHVELLGTMPTITVDKARIRQTLQNLLENALRHTAQNGHITLTVSQRLQDNRLVIVVIDDGDGIAPDQLPLVFDRLYRGDPARQRVGENTGLGLAITKALVEAHGGTIHAASSGVAEGSKFTITLPLS